MPRRTDPTRPFDLRVPIIRPNAPAATSATELDPTLLYRDRDWGLFVQVRSPDLISRQVYVTDPDPDGAGALGTEPATRDGTSWAQVHHDGGPYPHTVVQAGPRRLWTEIENLYREREMATDIASHRDDHAVARHTRGRVATSGWSGTA